MLKAGDISVELELNDSGFSTKIRKAGELVKQFNKDVSQLSKRAIDADADFRSLGTRLVHVSDEVGKISGMMAHFSDVFISLPRAIVESSAKIETMSKLMEGLAQSSGDAAKSGKAATEVAKEWTNAVVNMSQNSPFTMSELGNSFVKLKNGGVDPLNGSMKALVDSVAKFGGNDELLHRASVAIQQMGGKGVISMEELRQQLGEAVPNAMQLMAKGAGMSMQEFTKAVGKGQVESLPALRRMFAMMQVENGGAAEKLMDTWNGQMSKLKTNIMLFFNDVGTMGGDDSLFEGLKTQLEELNKTIQSPETKRFAFELGQSIKSLVTGFSNVIIFAAKYASQITDIAKLVAGIWITKKAVSYFDDIRVRATGMYQELSKLHSADVAARAQAASRNLALEIQGNEARLNSHRATLVQLKVMEEAFNQDLLRRRSLVDKLEAKGAIVTGVDANSRRLRALNDSIRAQQDALGGVNASILAHTREASAIEKANAALAVSKNSMSTLASKVVPALGTAVGLLGGPLGAIITALSLGMMAWDKWGNAAQKALDKAKGELASGTADSTTVQTLTAQVNAQKALVEKLSAEAANANKNKKDDKASPQEGLGAETYKLIAASRELATLQAQLDRATLQRKKNYNEESKRYEEEQLEIVVNGIKEVERKNHEAANAKIEGLRNSKKTQVEINAEISKIEKKQKDDAISSIDQQMAAISKRYNAIQAQIRSGVAANGQKLDDVSTSGLNARLEKISEEKKRLAALRADIAETGTKLELISTKGDGAPKLSAIEKFIDKMEEFRIKNLAVQEGLRNDTSVQKWSAQLDALVANDKIKVSAEQLEQLRKTAEEMDKAVAETDNLQKYASVIDQLQQKIGSYDEQLSGGTRTNAGLKAKVTELINLGTASGLTATEIAKLNSLLDQLNSKAGAVGVQNVITAANQELDSLIEKANGGSSALARLGAQLEQAKKDGASDADIETARAKLNEVRNATADGFLREQREINKKATADYLASISDQTTATNLKYDEELRQLEYLYDEKIRLLGEAKSVEIEAERDKAKQLLELKRAYDLRTPMEKVVAEWQKSSDRMRQATADFTTDLVDKMADASLGAKVSFSGMVEDFLKQIYKIQFQKQMGGLAQQASDWLTRSVESIFSDKSTTAVEDAGDAAIKAAKEFGIMNVAVGDGAAQSVAQATKSATLNVSLDSLSIAAQNAANALSQIAGMSAGAGGGSSGGGLFGGLFSDFSTDIFTDTGGWLSTAWDWFSGSGTGFANGGIMTNYGSLALEKYAKGGIANSPQLALFGEGRMPEAYVPLPDGRTIPVTMTGASMSGGTGGNVFVNIHNNADGTKATQQTSQNPDGSTNIDVFIDQIESKISANVSRGRGSLGKTMENIYALNRAGRGY